MTQGTKVTTDPESTRSPIQEGPGVITSDSLAAQSIEQGGSFAEGQHPGVSGQPSKGSTANTTDTSGATVLPPAVNVEARGDAAGFGDPAFAKQLDESGGDSEGAGFGAPGFKQALEDNGGEAEGGAGFGDASFAEVLKSSGGDSEGAGFDAPGFKESLQQQEQQQSSSGDQGGTAPSYVGIGQLREGEQKPKGSNLKEGSFDSSAPNASETTDIGSKGDPGRAAVEKFARQDALAGADAGGGGPKQTDLTGDGQYDALGGDTAA